MLIKIKALNGTVTEFDNLPDNPSVLELKTHVEDKLQIPKETQRLIFSGKELTDNNLHVSDYNIHDGTTVHLVVRNKPKPKTTVVAPPMVESPMSGGAGHDLEQQQLMPQQADYADYAQLQFPQGPADPQMNIEAVFDVVRLARSVKLIALCELFEILAFSILIPAMFPVALLAVCGIIAAETLRVWFIVPFCLLQLLTVVVMIAVFIPANVGISFVVLNILISAWVLFICIKFFRQLKSLSRAEIAEARSLQRVQAAGNAGF
jgi:hypothetical protein